MKKLIIICVLLATCNPSYLSYGQKKKITPLTQKLEDAWAQLKKSKDTTAMLITSIKNLSDQKIIYRTKLVERTDTVWRIDTCIKIVTKIDSATIALIFQQRDTAKPTTRGKKVLFFFRKKPKK